MKRPLQPVARVLDIISDFKFSIIPIHNAHWPAPRIGKPGKAPWLNGAPYSWNSHNYQRAPIDTVRRWIESGYNIAVVTGEISGCTVIDADDIQTARLIALERPTDCMVRTRQGLHLFYAYSSGVSNTVKTLLPGCDTRNNGGYVVFPPSWHQFGHQYQLMGNWEGLADTSFPSIQHTRHTSSTPNSNLVARATAYSRAVPLPTEGSRNNETFKLACALFRVFADLNRAEVYSIVDAWNMRFPAPLSSYEVEITVYSAERAVRGR